MSPTFIDCIDVPDTTILLTCVVSSSPWLLPIKMLSTLTLWNLANLHDCITGQMKWCWHGQRQCLLHQCKTSMICCITNLGNRAVREMGWAELKQQNIAGRCALEGHCLACCLRRSQVDLLLCCLILRLCEPYGGSIAEQLDLLWRVAVSGPLNGDVLDAHRCVVCDVQQQLLVGIALQ